MTTKPLKHSFKNDYKKNMTTNAYVLELDLAKDCYGCQY